MKCIYCKKECYKKGKRKGIQRYQCKVCKKYQQEEYIRPAISEQKYRWVIKLCSECCGIRSIGRLLSISNSSVQRIIIQAGSSIQKPEYDEENQVYEMDELRTYCGNKNRECWIMYAINKTTGKIIDFIVGRRTKSNIIQVVNSILLLNPKSIYTDGLNIYPAIIPKPVHKVFRYCTNKIERHNLTLRTHLKRLVRKTLCFTKSDVVLCCILKLYWYGIY
jgi:IS1 family transposase/transposase-like protein